jgi:hypothetical protein
MGFTPHSVYVVTLSVTTMSSECLLFVFILSTKSNLTETNNSSNVAADF